ncbi:MAG: hypothetical protein ACE5MI_00040 [Acidimicrobiia bacterium]
MTHVVVFGGPSPEHDISILTGLQAARTLVEGGTSAIALYWSKAGTWHEVDPMLEAADFVEGPPPKSSTVSFRAETGGGFSRGRKRIEIGVVLNACHGGPGEDGSLQAAFDLAGIRYTGPSASASALGMDKLAFAAVAVASGLPTLPRQLVDADAESPSFEPPFIVKPRFGGSSIGIEVVSDYATAVELAATSPLMRDGAVAEPFISGSRDVNVAVRTYPKLELSALEAPARPEGGPIYSYDQKYLSGGGLEGSERELPAVLPSSIETRIRAYAEQVARVAALRSVARIDFLVRAEDIWVNEVNTIPGSLAAYLWIDPPLSRFELLSGMLAEAEGEPARQFTAVGADGTALQSAATIAQKLG